jgi:hypothetical protein
MLILEGKISQGLICKEEKKNNFDKEWKLWSFLLLSFSRLMEPSPPRSKYFSQNIVVKHLSQSIKYT